MQSYSFLLLLPFFNHFSCLYKRLFKLSTFQNRVVSYIALNCLNIAASKNKFAELILPLLSSVTSKE